MVEEQVLTHPRPLNGDGGTASSSPTVEVIQDFDRFNEIEAEWDDFVSRSTADGVFLSHAWFRTWWEAFGEGNKLHVVAVRAAGQLLGLAPLMKTRIRIGGVHTNVLHSIYNSHTPRYDFIVPVNSDPVAYSAIWNQIMEVNDCDAIVLAQIPAESPTISAVEKLATSEEWRTGRWAAPASPFIPLSCDYPDFFNRLGPGCRFNLTKRYGRLRRLGPIDVEVVTEPDAIDRAMRDGLRIEAAAWKGEKGTAMLSDSVVADFYTRLARREAGVGRLRLNFLRAGAKRIAFSYLLQSGRKLYALKIGYDPEYHAYSPGNMLLNLVLKDACARGIAEYDLLGGDDEWKFEWTKEMREHHWLFLFRKGLRPRLLHFLKFAVVPAVKTWRTSNYGNTNHRNSRRTP